MGGHQKSLWSPQNGTGRVFKSQIFVYILTGCCQTPLTISSITSTLYAWCGFTYSSCNGVVYVHAIYDKSCSQLYSTTSRWLWVRVYNGWQVARLGHALPCVNEAYRVLGSKQEIRSQSRVDATYSGMAVYSRLKRWCSHRWLFPRSATVNVSRSVLRKWVLFKRTHKKRNCKLLIPLSTKQRTP